jgi:hypothetical protein
MSVMVPIPDSSRSLRDVSDGPCVTSGWAKTARTSIQSLIFSSIEIS